MISTTPTAVRLRIRVQSRSSRDRVVGAHDDAVKIQVTAPPVEGAANQAVVGVIADWLGVARRTVTIARGQASRDKVVEVASGDPPHLAARISALLEGCVDKAQGSD